MKKVISIFFISMALLFPIILSADQQLTTSDVEAFMASAIKFGKEKGRDALFAEIVNPKGPFIKGQLYIAAMSNDIRVIVHGAKPHINGADMSRLTDKNGVNIGKAYMEAMANGNGWCEYYWPNPVTGRIQKKFGFGARFDKDSWLLTGYYP